MSIGLTREEYEEECAAYEKRIARLESASASHLLEIEKLADENRSLRESASDAYDLGFRDGVNAPDEKDAEIKALREQVRWIPVSERLPELGAQVWLFDGYSAWHDEWTVSWVGHPEIKAWMRRQTKPAPPQEQKV